MSKTGKFGIIGLSLKGLALCVLGIGAASANAENVAAQGEEPLYISPTPDDMNVMMVENHIVIDRPADKVFDYISTPANTARWFVGPGGLGMSAWEVVRGGPADQPQQLGDQAMETITPVKEGDPPRKVLYTVVSLVPGHQWIAVGQFLGPDGKPSERIATIADWSVKALPDGRSMFVRVFMAVRPDAHTPTKRSGAFDAAFSQAVLERLKRMIEDEVPEE